METNVRSPLDVFHLPQHLVVPLFQRPYVWNEADQWVPLWQDVQRIAELRLGDPFSQATHFLGAVVLQAQDNVLGNLQPRNIIDGQQRLTTLQLLMDAAAAVLESAGEENLAGQLEELTQNSHRHVQTEGDVLKVRHTNRDRDAYDEVMRADPPIDYDSLDHHDALVVRAHRFFHGQVLLWLGDRDAGGLGDRARALVEVLSRGLQLVAIDLRATENSQEIFETLNARGTPLTAADLIKNYVFQTLEAEGADVARAYAEDWPFEKAFWEKDVSVGRYFVSRGSLFLNQWLMSRLGEEISPKHTFARFKSYVEHDSHQKMSELLPVIKEQADAYEKWAVAASDPHRDLDPIELNIYRTQAANLELLKPMLIWLHEPGSTPSTATIHRVVASCESWIMRRLLMRLPTSNLGRVVANLISSHGDRPDDLAERVEQHLSRLNSATTYWPGDDEVRSSLQAENAYRRFPRARLRMLLEVAEDHLRGYTGQRPAKAHGRIGRTGLPIEHVLPQKWADNWPVDGLAAELARTEHVHRLGNLTLLTASLNSSVSNSAWLGVGGKRDKLQEHDVLLLNRDILRVSADGWDERRIDARTERLIDALLATWPVPAGHVGAVVDPLADEPAWIGLGHLVAAGLLSPGDKLLPRPAAFRGRNAELAVDGTLLLEGKAFGSPSAAGHHLRQRATNGWNFWKVPDGRRLSELRDIYRQADGVIPQQEGSS